MGDRMGYPKKLSPDRAGTQWMGYPPQQEYIYLTIDYLKKKKHRRKYGGYKKHQKTALPKPVKTGELTQKEQTKYPPTRIGPPAILQRVVMVIWSLKEPLVSPLE